MKIEPGMLVIWNGAFIGNVRPIGLVLEKYVSCLGTSIFNTGWWVLNNDKKAIWFEDEFEKVSQ